MQGNLPSGVSMDNLPVHIAVIMDGNRRWARMRGLPSAAGHREGERTFHRIVEFCSNLGIRFLTVYAFSAENWKRSAEEVGVLMNLFEFYMREERRYILRENVRFRIIGDRSGLPASVLREFEKTERESAGATGMTLCLAVNYGGRGEILEAARRMCHDVMNGAVRLEDMDESSFEGYLMTGGMPSPDLLIRTSGEERLSNFLLWQCAYSEFYFTDVLWPDFDEDCMRRAIEAYGSRHRRFGGGA